MKKLTQKQIRETLCAHAMCVMLGANAAIKLEPNIPLGTKVYFRLIRDQAQRAFIENGGKIDKVTLPGEILILPTQPTITFYATDIEAMRALVAEHDAKRAKKKK